MADDFRDFLPQGSLDGINMVVHVDDGELRVNNAMIVHNQARLGLTDPHIMDIPDRGGLICLQLPQVARSR